MCIQNVSTGNMGHKVGQVHMNRQNLQNIAYKKTKAKRQRIEVIIINNRCCNL